MDLMPGSSPGELFAGTCDGGLFVTHGNGWTKVADPPAAPGSLGTFARSPDGSIYAATGGGLLVHGT